MRRLLLLTLLGLLAPSAARAAEAKPLYAQRWFYAAHNLQVEKNADALVTLIERAGKAGYNGVVLADYKFNILGRVPAHYFKNVARVKKAAAKAKVEIIPSVCPIGYSAGLLAHDPNLAEGLPVKEAPFVVKGGQAVLAAPGSLLRNGGLEEYKGHAFAGFAFQDGPGKMTFVDTKVVRAGKASCRMQDVGKHAAPHGNCRLAQRVKLRPYACYRLSAWVKTRDLSPAGAFKLLVLGAGK